MKAKVMMFLLVALVLLSLCALGVHLLSAQATPGVREHGYDGDSSVLISRLPGAIEVYRPTHLTSSEGTVTIDGAYRADAFITPGVTQIPLSDFKNRSGEPYPSGRVVKSVMVTLEQEPNSFLNFVWE